MDLHDKISIKYHHHEDIARKIKKTSKNLSDLTSQEGIEDVSVEIPSIGSLSGISAITKSTVGIAF